MSLHASWVDVQPPYGPVLHCRLRHDCRRLHVRNARGSGFSQTSARWVLGRSFISDPMSIFWLTGYYTEPYERFLALYLAAGRDPVLFCNGSSPTPAATARTYWSSPMSMIRCHWSRPSPATTCPLAWTRTLRPAGSCRSCPQEPQARSCSDRCRGRRPFGKGRPRAGPHACGLGHERPRHGMARRAGKAGRNRGEHRRAACWRSIAPSVRRAIPSRRS